MSLGQSACRSRVVELAMGVGALGLEEAAGVKGVETNSSRFAASTTGIAKPQEIEAWAATGGLPYWEVRRWAAACGQTVAIRFAQSEGAT
jgi:hypothetical protein